MNTLPIKITKKLHLGQLRFLLPRLAAIVAIAHIHAIHAQTITPVSVTASSTFSSSQTANNLINHSGLSAGSDVSMRTHDAQGSAFTMWHSSGGAVSSTWIEFDLGTQYSLTGIRVWNMNQANLTGRGIREIRILSSTTATGTITDVVGTYEFDRGTGNTGLTSQLITFLAPVNSARRLRLEAISVWSGATNEYTGLSEIRFEGTAPAKVITSPQSATAYVEGRHAFSTVGAGTGSLTYAWYRKGTPDLLLQSSSSPSLIIDPVSINNAGQYYVTVADGSSSDTSDLATLTVIDAPVDITSSLLAHYTFDETAGSTASDSSGNGNTALLENFFQEDSPWTAGRIGGALEFNRNDAFEERVTTQQSITLENENQFSFSFWCRLGSENVSNNPRIIVPVGDEHWVLWSPGYQGLGFFPNVTTPEPQLNIWSHYVITYDRSIGLSEVFVDGNKQNEDLNVQRFSPIGKRWTMGGNENLFSDSDPWRGALDDMRIYNRILRPKDIKELYAVAGEPILPQLKVLLENGNVTASWQSGITGYTLESSTDLEIWNPIGGVNNNSITLPLSSDIPREFFRLRKN